MRKLSQVRKQSTWMVAEQVRPSTTPYCNAKYLFKTVIMTT